MTDSNDERLSADRLGEKLAIRVKVRDQFIPGSYSYNIENETVSIITELLSRRSADATPVAGDWVMVPREPTREMLSKAEDAHLTARMEWESHPEAPISILPRPMRDAYRAMLSAAPPASRIRSALEPVKETAGGEGGKAVAWRWRVNYRDDWCWSTAKPSFSPLDLERGMVFDIQPLYVSPLPAGTGSAALTKLVDRCDTLVNSVTMNDAEALRLCAVTIASALSDAKAELRFLHQGETR